MSERGSVGIDIQDKVVCGASKDAVSCLLSRFSAPTFGARAALGCIHELFQKDSNPAHIGGNAAQ